ncbi:MAG: M15 family metallopeptidase [Clostridiales bacterium]|nr:M15 family metallopeptidase [Clostridiales bacterium]
MSNARKDDPFRRLLKWTIVLLLLFAVFATGFVLLDKYQKGEVDRQAQRIAEENEKIIEDYNRARAEFQASLESGEAKTWPEAKQEGWDVVDVSDFPVNGAREQAVTRAELLKGGLLLVNRWHEMPPDFTLVEGDIKSIGVETNYRVPVENANVLLMNNVITHLDKMIADAKAAGHEYYIAREGYRTAQTQLENWENESKRYEARYSGDALVEKVRERVAYPGTSDYHTAMSVYMDVYNRNDSALNNMKFQTTTQADWMNQHCHEYGFVFRFPVQGYPSLDTVDKSFITGINLEMDTYRYVGIPHAAVMRHMGFCLEEYIDYLIAHPHLAVYQDGVLKYEIYRLPGGNEDTTISLPANATDYLASTDNMGGIIVAAIY